MSVLFDLLFLIIAGVFIFFGVWRGFIKSLVRSAKFLLAILFAYLFGSMLGLFFKDAFIGNMVYTPVRESVASNYEEMTSGLDVDEIMENLPSFAVTDEVRQAIVTATDEESGEALIDAVAGAIADPIASGISNALGYAVVFLLSILLLTVVAWLLTAVIDRIAFIGLANHILGGVWGALTALLLLLVITSVIKAFWGADPLYEETVLVKLLGDSGMLDALGFLNVGNILA